MNHSKLAIGIMLILASVAPTVHAASKVRVGSPASASSQAGGLPATNARVTALEAAVVTLRSGLAAEIAARQAADTALADQIAANQSTVFIAEGSADNIKGATVTVASKILPAGTYFTLAAVQMVNAQTPGNANARCILSANGTLLADTTDLQFPILSTEGGTTGNAFGSTMFAPLQGTYSSSTPITVSVACTESNGDNGGLNAFVQIAALKVGGVQ
jgi:hypothetical protein